MSSTTSNTGDTRVTRARNSQSRRLGVLACSLVLGIAIIEWRLIQLQVLRHEELEEKAANFRFTNRTQQAWRGQIRERSGIPLAVSVPAKNIFTDLTVWSNRIDLLAGIVAPLVGVDQSNLVRRVRQSLAVRDDQTDARTPRVLLLRRGMSPTDWAKVRERIASENFGLQTNRLSSRQRTLLKALRRWTLFAVDDQRRYFPHGESLAQVLGFVGSSTNGHLLQGKWGIEGSLDYLLAGQNGLRVSSHDAAGNELAFCRTTNLMAQDGTHVVLTIDLKLQKIVESALQRVMAAHQPDNASCIVVKPATGEILALASQPAFYPQSPGAGSATAWRNHAISDRNEVGSAFKVITLATALDLGLVNLEERIFCENGRWRYRGSTLHDDGHSHGFLTVRECLAKSSNIGLAKIALLVGPRDFYQSLLNFGFDRPTGLPLPFESPGFLRPPSSWTPTSLTRLAIGHELATSQIQLVMAYAAIANDGKLMRPMLVSQLYRGDGSLWGNYEPKFVRSVLKPETARQVREAMRDVVERGTGKLAALPEHTVCGKTGTAQKSDGRRYVPGRLYCSFVGMLPVAKPELVIAVAVDEPRDGAYGGTVAAPVFREIADQAVLLYNIPPDKTIGYPRHSFASENATAGRDWIARSQ